MQKELIVIAKPTAVISSSSAASFSSFNEASIEEKQLIERASAIEAKVWYALSRWAKETNNFQSWQRSIVFSVGQLIARGRKPSYKQSVQALKVYDEAITRGFSG